MTRILSELLTRNLDDERWVQLYAPFIFESDVLKKAGLKSSDPFHPDWVTIPTGFVQDFESIPMVRGQNKRGGTVHDYLSCEDSDPLVTKQIAAAVYFEICAYCDSLYSGRNNLTRITDWDRRWSKWAVVRVWPFYFHQRKVMATCLEIAGVDGDPYVTAEKLDAAIVQSKEATAAIKEVPGQVAEKPAMVAASEQVTTDLKDAKAEVIEKAEVK